MGMAASQARYLALTARKTNTEYEGQQINQARTALANQSANLFNRLLNMKVPDPPKTSDYTKVQYSYSDGENASVIDEWHQLSTADPDYNYLVTTHYYADLYTGALRKMTDPQVQIGNNAPNIADLALIDNAKSEADQAYEASALAYEAFQQTLRDENAEIAIIQNNAQNNNGAHSVVNSSIINYQLLNQIGGYDEHYIADGDGNGYSIFNYVNPAEIADPAHLDNANAILTGVHDMIETGILDLNTLNSYLGGNFVTNADDIISNLPAAIPPEYSDMQNAILQTFGLSEVFGGGTGERHIVRMRDITSLSGDVYNPATGDLAHIHNITGTFLDDLTAGTETPSLNSFVTNPANGINAHKQQIALSELAYTTANLNYQAKLDYYENLGIPTYIGNSELTYLDQAGGLTDEQRTELLQIISDMRAQNIDTNLEQYFDAANNYLGGIYSFKMNGVTYYTTYDDLVDAYNSYQTNANHNNYIDGQYKMPYYNASYVNTKIEQTLKALMETDGSGRFKTVRFDNNSVVYSLNTETVTDEAAYEDAMNHYIYEKEKYEKTIADINAKTSIIQKEDRTLELRLKQLDTEQLALKTEMDAVKKVIKDNVESTFKTFSD